MTYHDKCMKYKFHYFYKITNNLNSKFYYGIHSTDNLDDGYMGSGVLLHKAYEKYGIENFTKEIIKIFSSREECSDYESKIITEGLVRDNMCYNLVKGGDSLATSGMLTVKDKDGNVFLVYPDDKRWINGELVGSTKGFVNCYDKTISAYTQVEKSEFINNKNKYNGITSGLVTCRLKNSNDKFTLMSKENFYSNKDKYETPTSNTILCKNKNGNIYRVPVESDIYKSGELKSFWSGLKHSESTKEKMRKKHKENGGQKGEKNSQYGTCWITKNGINKKIKKDNLDSYLKDGWRKGRVI